MDVTPLIRQGTQVIQSYSENGFKVSAERYKTNIIVTPEQSIEWTKKRTVNDLTGNDFIGFLEDMSYDVCLLGTGKTFTFPPTSLLKKLKDQNIKPEIMDTGAACRTYNVLMAEDRRVVALLLIPE